MTLRLDAKRRKWRSELMEDELLGHPNFGRTVNVCDEILKAYGKEMGTVRLAALREMWEETGVGDHIEMVKFVLWAGLNPMQRFRREGSVPSIQSKELAALLSSGVH